MTPRLDSGGGEGCILIRLTRKPSWKQAQPGCRLSRLGYLGMLKLVHAWQDSNPRCLADLEHHERLMLPRHLVMSQRRSEGEADF